MILAQLAALLFPGTAIPEPDPHGVSRFAATTEAGQRVVALAIGGGQPLGVEAALCLAGHVLDHLAGPTRHHPIALLVDTASQRMSRRDELLCLADYLAHLNQSLLLAALTGHRTVAILHGPAAAGAFLATALATTELVAVDGADPSVMDLPSISRITAIPLDRLRALAERTPVFAPGLDALFDTGAVTERWHDPATYGRRFDALLLRPAPVADDRDQLGRSRGGRLVARRVADRIGQAATDRPS